MLSTGVHGRMVDFYQIGALLYEMIMGLPPLYSQDKNKMYIKIVNETPTYSETKLTKDARDLL
jgi:serum/glucocorticoid-regulated kinase 2